jgi:hypothetical protein
MNRERKSMSSTKKCCTTMVATSLALALAPSVAAADVEELLKQTSSAAGYAALWISHDKTQHADLQKLSLLNDLAMPAVTQCEKATAAALAGGAASKAAVKFDVYQSQLTSPLPLGEIQAKVCGPARKVVEGALKKMQSADDEKLAPFRKALSGDKLATWEKYCKTGASTYGKGGRELTTPAQFAKAPAWYWYTRDKSGIVPRWEVSGYRFKGMKKVGGVYKKSGTGNDPPASAFP